MNETLDKKLLFQEFEKSSNCEISSYLAIAKAYSVAENALVILSDLKRVESHIFYGGYAEYLGLGKKGEFKTINSIWENEVFRRIVPNDLERKHLEELKFFDYMKRNCKESDCFMQNIIRMRNRVGVLVEVIHRIFYFKESNAIRYAMCLYTPAIGSERSVIVNPVTSKTIYIDDIDSNNILSDREKEILKMIDLGFSSKEISANLNISIFTVSRHRQNILEKLQAKNSLQACCTAKSLKIL